MSKTEIGWTDETWNCIRGCTEVSPGCAHCYAREQAARIVRMDAARRAANPTCKAGSYDRVVQIRNGKARWTDVVEFDAEKLAEPLRWKRPRRVFVNSMSDLFHESLTNEQIAAVFGVMAASPQHTFQVLTKRAPRMREWFAWAHRDRWCSVDMFMQQCAMTAGVAIPLHEIKGTLKAYPWPPPNVWLGVSVEDRKHGAPRIVELRQTPAAVRFLSCEPLLEDLGTLDLTGIGWLIDGCESGPGARPAEDAWFASLEEQCRAASVPYFHKQQMVNGRLEHDFPGRQEFPR